MPSAATSCETTIGLADLQFADPRLSVAYVGDYDAYVVLLMANCNAVEQLLPRQNLKLAPQPLVPSGKHPLIMLVGRQSNVRREGVPREKSPCLTALGLAMTYLEIIVAVPFVCHGADVTTLVCSTKLVLEDRIPTMLGWLCGFPKSVGRLCWQGPRYHAETMRCCPLLDGTFYDRGTYQPPSSYPNFGSLRAIFEQTHIGRLMHLPLVCTHLDFQLDTHAAIRPIEGSVRIFPHLCPLLSGTYNIQPLDHCPLGGFRLQTSWRLPAPGTCP